MTMLPSFRAVIAHHIADKLEATPYVVPQPGLLRSVMGDDVFLTALDERRRWIAAQCRDGFHLTDLKNGDGDVIGKSYRFNDELIAIGFRLMF